MKRFTLEVGKTPLQALHLQLHRKFGAFTKFYFGRKVLLEFGHALQQSMYSHV